MARRIRPARALTTRDIQRIYGVSARTARRWCLEGEFGQLEKRGQHWRIPVSALPAIVFPRAGTEAQHVA